jgi:hypothetical protein
LVWCLSDASLVPVSRCPVRQGYRLKVATTAEWSDGAVVCGVGSSVIDGSGVAATICTAGMLSG